MLMQFLDYSGAPTMFMWVAEALHKRGHQVTICTYKTLRNDIKMSDGIKWIDLTPKKLGVLGCVREIRSLIGSLDPDVSISFQLNANIINMLACYGKNTKSVVCERNDPYRRGKTLQILKPLFKMADGAVFQLPGAREYYNNIKVPVAIIPNPFVAKTDIRCESHDKRKHVIATHGRLDIVQKRQDLLIEAFAMFVKQYPDYQLQIYGSQWPGSDDNIRLEQQIEDLGLQNSAHLMGVSNKPQQDIKSAMMWVSTSDFEGISNAMMDAMAIGIPVVVTDCSPGGAAFMIKNKENGLLVERGNAKAVYEGMLYIAEHPEEADRMGMKATEIEENFDGDKIAMQWESYLTSLINKQKNYDNKGR